MRNLFSCLEPGKASTAAICCLTLALAACSGNPPPDTPGAVFATIDAPNLPGPSPISHGNDPPTERPRGLTAESPPEAAWPCEGDGSDGRRVQLLYAHAAGSPGLTAAGPLRLTLESYARRIEGIFLSSARDTGGERLVRFVTGPNCALSIIDVTLSAGALGSFDAMVSELAGAGFNSTSRAYHAWVDANAYCGIGSLYDDDRATPANWNNVSPAYARSDRNCWGGHTEAHEIAHNLGAVQHSAPNATGGFHCRDESDVMCYADGAPKGQMRQVCPISAEDRLDCGKDDYFSTAPAGYLSTHWNVAENSALSRSVVSTTSTTVPPIPTTTTSSTSTTLPPTTTTTVGQGKSTVNVVLPDRVRAGTPFIARAEVTGDCGPAGTVAFYVSGKLLSRQVIVDGAAEVTLTFAAPGRYTIRAYFGGSPACGPAQESVRKRVS